jgi:hypothetical protein
MAVLNLNFPNSQIRADALPALILNNKDNKETNMKNYLIIALSVLLNCYVNMAFAGHDNIKISNVTGRQFTVSWTTDQPCIATLKLYDESGFIKTCHDDRGDNLSSIIHYFTVKKLKSNTRYSFSIANENMIDDQENELYHVTTDPGLFPLIGSTLSSGQILYNDSKTPVSEAIVYITVIGPERNWTSALLSTLVNADGDWDIELFNARESDFQKLFNVKRNGKSVIIHVDAGNAGTAEIEKNISSGNNLYQSVVLN